MWVRIYDVNGKLVATQPWSPGKSIGFVAYESMVIDHWDLVSKNSIYVTGTFQRPIAPSKGDKVKVDIEAGLSR
jgi:hypothetical protein